jgi:hypothetical protein
MSFLKKLFGGGGTDDGRQGDGPAKVLGSEEYKGFTIRAVEMRVGGEFQLCGEIEMEIDGETKSQSFIRADRLTGAEEAARITLAKGRQVIDEQGEAVFDASRG